MCDKPKMVALVSGGMDSAVLVRYLQNKGYDVRGLSVHYGQSHSCELDAARELCESLDVPQLEVDIGTVHVLLGRSVLTNGGEIPEGHYADESMKKTVVPNRNMIMLSIAAGYALTQEAEGVAYAGHAGDHAIYPDCRPEFFALMKASLAICDYTPLSLVAPFITWTKTEICRYGLRHGVPFHLTYSCYKGGKKACGKCGTCVERLEAFKENEYTDPIEYE